MSFFKKLSDTVSKGVSTATEKAQQTVEVTKLNSQISSKRKDIDKLFASIGESVYEGYLAQDLSVSQSKVLPACEKISEIRAEIEALESRIKEIRNEKDCVCGKLVPYDTRFCPSCGHPFPIPEPPVQEKEPVVESEPSETQVSADPEKTDSKEPAAEVAEEPESAPRDQRNICNSCGTPLYADSHFCPACGQSTRLQSN